MLSKLEGYIKLHGKLKENTHEFLNFTYCDKWISFSRDLGPKEALCLEKRR